MFFGWPAVTLAHHKMINELDVNMKSWELQTLAIILAVVGNTWC
jgi:hypothetical protein